ncbi:MAG: Response regulator [Acidobacteriota bacterium]|nr:Response regulator [Acidobacteriota bacterium]
MLFETTARPKSMAKLFFYNSLIVISILTVTFSIVFIFNRYANFDENIKNLEKNYFREQLQLIDSRVNEVIDYIQYSKSRTEGILQDNIKEKTYEAHAIATNIYKTYKNTKSTAEIKRLIINTLRPIRYNKGRGYYFIDDINGNIVLIHQTYEPIWKEGQNILDTKDIYGKFVIKEFVEIARTRKEGFSSYHWGKLGEEKQPIRKKISYIKLFEPFGWIIGTGEYVDDVERDIQANVLTRINSMRYGTDRTNYFFVLKLVVSTPESGADSKWKLIMLVNPNRPDLVGQELTEEFKDDKGNYFLKGLVNPVLEKGECVTEYWFKKMSDSHSTKKTTYARLAKDWNWIIGGGFYRDELEKLIALNRETLEKNVKEEIIFIIGIFIFIFFLAMLISMYFSREIKNEFNIFSNFFNESAKKNEVLDKSKLEIFEFKELADAANRMISDKKAGEEALLKAKEAAEAATRAKSEFLANVSHEIRTPLNAIIGMSDILGQTQLNDEQYEYLEIINTSGSTLLVIINDILDFSKIEAGKMDLEHVNFSVAEAVEAVADMEAPKAHKKGLEIIPDVDADIPQEVLGDSGRLHQILLNLADNAVKFTDKGEIFISAQAAEKSETEIKLLFTVKDTGIGISEDRQRDLFKSFSQLDASTTRKYGGTGLGLAICKKLTELLKGEIGVESKEGVGTSFWFTAVFDLPTPGIPKTTVSPLGLNGLCVLIVDDNRTNRLILKKYLESWGCTCHEAVSAEEALVKMYEAATDQKPFPIALLDYLMPGVSGDQLARAIKQDEKLKDTRLVLLTSSIMYKSQEELEEMGFMSLLNKPVKQSVLYNCIARIMGFAKPEERVDKRPVKTFTDLKKLDRGPLDILLVEDNYFNQRVALFNLQKFNHRVDLAENGKAAVDKFKNNRYDLILMDVQMPIMDGYEATEIIRRLEKEDNKQNNRDSHTPIIAMTANAMKEDVEKAYQLGMNAYLAKPFNSGKFLTVINEIAHTSRK